MHNDRAEEPEKDCKKTSHAACWLKQTLSSPALHFKSTLWPLRWSKSTGPALRPSSAQSTQWKHCFLQTEWTWGTNDRMATQQTLNTKYAGVFLDLRGEASMCSRTPDPLLFWCHVQVPKVQHVQDSVTHDGKGLRLKCGSERYFLLHKEYHLLSLTSGGKSRWSNHGSGRWSINRH